MNEQIKEEVVYLDSMGNVVEKENPMVERVIVRKIDKNGHLLSEAFLEIIKSDETQHYANFNFEKKL